MEQLNQQILDCLKQGHPFAVATIMTHKGSTPRTSGSKMIVLKDRTIYGTIGGGVVEAGVIDTSLEMIERKKCRLQEFALNNELKDGLDMVCGGEMVVLIEAFVPDSALISLFQALTALEQKGKKAFLISIIKGVSKSDFSTQKWLGLPDGSVMNITVTPNTSEDLIPKSLFDAIVENQFSGSSPVIYNQGFTEFIIEPIHAQDKIFIFGAGHVGFQLARMAHITDFQTIVMDDREEFANHQRFPHAGEVHVVDHFNHAFDNLSINANSYIVILTRGHLHDQTVLEAALKTDAAYIGMIGSRSKRDQIYSNLAKKGISHQTLETVYSPIGLEINSETPAEIAVSIIGQIIQIRAKQ